MNISQPRRPDLTCRIPFLMEDREVASGIVTFDYDVTLPVLIAMTFNVGDGELTRWIVSRDLLIAGISSEFPQGIGDVRLHRDSHLVRLVLHSPEGRASVRLDREPLRRFLEGTTCLVEPETDDQHGPESAAIHRAMNAWLAEVFEAESC